jgi:hypothetical protein
LQRQSLRLPGGRAAHFARPTGNEIHAKLSARPAECKTSNQLEGEKGIHEMEADIVRGFEKLVRDYETVQFMDGLKKEFG